MGQLRRIGGILALCVLATAPAMAQRAPKSAVAQLAEPTAADRAAYDEAFNETLRKPGDPAVLIRFAELAVTVGDLEGAISALERLLLIEGDQPKVKLELGVLY